MMHEPSSHSLQDYSSTRSHQCSLQQSEDTKKNTPARDRSQSRCRRYDAPQLQRSCRRRKEKRYAAIIIRRFAVDVSALLFPSTCSAIPCVNTNVTGVRPLPSLPSPQWQRSCRRRKGKRYCRYNHPPLRRRCQRLAVPKHLSCYSMRKYERDRSYCRCRRYDAPQ